MGEAQGELWGARAESWAEQEQLSVPIYEQAAGLLGVGAETSVLDVGCGSGVFLRTASDRGARVSGLDASTRLLELARRRIPAADLRVGDLQSLPWDDGAFDVVTGFNAFQFASDTTAALHEARRVATAGASVFALVWGRPDRCDLTAANAAVKRFLPTPPSSVSPPVSISEPGVLEGMMLEAGLRPDTSGTIVSTFTYPDEDTMARLVLSAALGVRAVRAAGENAVRAALLESLAPFRTPAGGYELENEWRYVIART